MASSSSAERPDASDRSGSFGQHRPASPVDQFGVWLSSVAVRRHANFAGARLGDRFVPMPPARAEDFGLRVVDLCREHRIDLVFPILDYEFLGWCTVAGRLRIEHRQASLEELGQLASPPLTKDAIAGRIRRLLAMADKRARDLGVPDTEASLTPEQLEEARRYKT